MNNHHGLIRFRIRILLRHHGLATGSAPDRFLSLLLHRSRRARKHVTAGQSAIVFHFNPPLYYYVI